MKRKGFTLVELLAVIAILAILVIIALPNVMGMFNTAKENSFKTEVKEIYKVAQNQWMQDSMYQTGEVTYTRCSGCTGKSLDLSGRSELEYFIKINKAGNVVEYYATDGTFQYSYSGDGLKVESINSVQKIADLSSNQKISISDSGVNGSGTYYVYYTGDPRAYIGFDEPTEYVYDNYMDAINSHKYWKNENEGYKFFNRLKISNGKITELHLGYYLNGNVYYLKALDPSKYEENTSIMSSSFPSNKCAIGGWDAYLEDNSVVHHENYTCYIAGDNTTPGLYVYVGDDGSVDAFDSKGGNSSWSCTIYNYTGDEYAPYGAHCTSPD